MQVKETKFEGLMHLVPAIYHDSRGWFYEFRKEPVLASFGIDVKFTQDNLSFSKKNVVRGLHFQLPPHGQAKLVTVLKGKVLDVVVDLRRDSGTFGQVYQCQLDSDQKNLLFIPEGFAHGFAALEDSIFFYKCSSPFHKPSESGIRWNDPELSIDWQVPAPVVSEKDRLLPTLQHFLQDGSRIF